MGPREKGQTAAAIRAAELLGKELGMFIERREQGRPGDFADLPEEELDRRIIAQLDGEGHDGAAGQSGSAGARRAGSTLD